MGWVIWLYVLILLIWVCLCVALMAVNKVLVWRFSCVVVGTC